MRDVDGAVIDGRERPRCELLPDGHPPLAGAHDDPGADEPLTAALPAMRSIIALTALI